MKEAVQHKILVLGILVIVAGSISVFLNNASFNPDFSMLDALTGATRKAHHAESESVSESSESLWEYTRDDIQLPEEAPYVVEKIATDHETFYVLKKSDSTEQKEPRILLSNSENSAYQQAVQSLAGVLRAQGENVQIKECTETVMLSMAHAEKFDYFLLSEVEQP